MNTTACNYTPCDGYDPPCLENCQRQFPKIGCCGCEMMLRETAFACGGSYIPKVRRTWELYSGAALRDMLGTLPCMHVGGAGGTPLSVRLLSAILVQPFSRHPPAERPIGNLTVGATADKSVADRSVTGQSLIGRRTRVNIPRMMTCTGDTLVLGNIGEPAAAGTTDTGNTRNTEEPQGPRSLESHGGEDRRQGGLGHEAHQR